MPELTEFNLKYGTGYVKLEAPAQNIMGILLPEDMPGVADPAGEVRRSLREPIGSKPLGELARDKKRVVILCSDITRPSPSYLLVLPVLEELNRAGIKDEQITVVFGLGYHRRHSVEEMKKLVGEQVYKRVQCLDHDRDDCIDLGKSSRGTPIRVFRPVTEADFVIGTANLELHYFAGYSGGHKSLMPGVCSKETIQANHAMLFDSKAKSGALEGNPIREDIEEIGSRVGMHFIVNAVLNSRYEIVRVVAGDAIKAHREGCRYIDRMYKRNIEQRADIVICSAGGHPKDINLYQAQKAFENASYAVRENGVIILVARCGELLGEATFSDWMNRASSPDDPLRWIREEFVLGAHKAAVICNVIKKVKAYLVSDMPDDLTRKCFFEPARTVNEALDKAMEELGQKARILILPYANSTVPHLEE